MVRLLGYSSRVGIDTDDPGPREILRTPSTAGDNGWLIRFFDSSFFCEWIAVSYLYKHEHSGVRDYLCNRMYSLPISGVENYLFQLCYMLLHMPSPSLEKYIQDMCSKSLRIAIKVHWFLLAESEDVAETKEVLRLQESCQMAAVMGDWPPLIRPQNVVISPGKSRMFKLLSSRRILPLTTSSPPLKPSPPPPLTVPDEALRDPGRSDMDESDSFMKVLKKCMPGPKVRDAIFKKFREKEDEESAERPSKDTSKDSESDSFFRRFLFREKEDEDKSVRNDESLNSDSFFRRFFREKADSEERNRGAADDEEKDGFFRKFFRDKSEDRDRGGDRSEDDDRDNTSCEEDESGELSFFRRFFKFHSEDDDKSLPVGFDSSALSTPENSPGHEGFFKKLFRERDRSLEDSRALNSRKEDGSPVPSTFLRRLFKERTDEEAMNLSEDLKVLHISHNLNDAPKLITKLGEVFKVGPVRNGFHDSDYYRKEGSAPTRTESYAAEPKGQDSMEEDRKDVDDGYETEAPDNAAKDGPGSFLKASPDPVITRKISFSSGSSKLLKHPGSAKRKLERTVSKPPLPKYSSFRIRKGVYYASLDFVQSLCDTSSGLVDVFPVEDRRAALLESIEELNSHLTSAENDGGVCFPMGNGLSRVVHIPEDEAVLLNSREKAPYLICLEVLKCDLDSSTKVPKDRSTKGPRNGIPVANGDVQLPRPPPWAYSVLNQGEMNQANTEHYLKSASKAIDVAMAHLWEAKLKFVDVTLQVAPMKPPEEVQVMLREDDSDTCTSRDLPEADCAQGVQSRCGDGDKISAPWRNGVFSHTSSDARNTAPQPGGEKERNVEPERGAEALQGNVCDEWVSVVLTAVPGLTMDDVVEEQPTKRREHRRVPSTIAMAEVTAAAAKGEAPPGLPKKKNGTGATVTTPSKETGGSAPKATDALAGELWEHKKERIKRSSKFGSIPEWDLCSMIVKSGDDCRQEHLAVQLVAHFHDIFVEANLPLWLRPYEVVVTSSHTALIETIPDTASIHAIKSRNLDLSLRDFFVKKYKEGSPALKHAQKNFVESMAGYSILCYLLQVKDRHNANLLLDEEGHIIHIDFGFMLYNSPGGVNFESAPFKLTRELLEVMDSDAEGTNSELFDYFKYLCIEGFLTCRKHAERIILLVEMMQDSGCPCFKGGQRTIQNLRKRFHLSLTEEQCVSLVLSLVNSSLDAWRTRQYDYYQRVLNGIL